MSAENGRALTETVIRPPGQWPRLDLAELWQFRAICVVLVLRILKVRYKQTVIGAAWAILQPLLLMLVFTIFFGILVRVPSEGVPYPLFVLIGLVAWQLFVRGLSDGSSSVVMNPHLITKIYFPRSYLPLAVIVSALVDLFFALLTLVPLLIWYGVAPGWPALLLPGLVAIACAAALGASLWLSTLYAAYRDIGHLLPFLTQLWMFCSPVIYPTSLVPPEFHLLYALNPMVTVIDGLRWGLVGSEPPSLAMATISTAVSLALLATGYLFFRRREDLLSDVV